MFEATFQEGATFKRIIDSMRDLVTDATFDCSASGITLQAMDSSHVSLCALLLKAEGFSHYRCDRNMSLGLNLVNVGKILKCANNTDMITLKADDEGDVVSFIFESESGNSMADFEMKLMDIDADNLGIPDTEYKCTVKMPSSEFQRIVRDLSVLGDTCTVGVTKEGVKFSVAGDLGTGNITRKQHEEADKPEDSTLIDMQEPVEMTFALRYLNFFTKATALSGTVSLSMSPEVPLVVEYNVEGLGYVRYYLAPKVDDA